MTNRVLTTAGGVALLLLLLALAGCGAGRTPTPFPTPTHTAVPATPAPLPTATATPIPTPTPDPVVELTQEGVSLFWKSDFGAAESVLHEALALDDRAVDTYKALALLYCFSPGRESEATEAAEEAVSLAPRDAEAHTVLARALMFSCRYEEALAAAENAVELDPRSSSAHSTLARAHLRLNHYTEARDAAERGVGLDSGSSWAHSGLGLVYDAMWLKNESLAELHTAAALQPSFAPWPALLADSYWRMLGDDVRSREYVTQALALDEGSIPALAMQVELELDAKNYDTASGLCNQMKEQAPTSAVGYIYQSYVYQDQEMFDDALAECEVAIELAPDADYALRALSWAHLVQEDYDEAIAAYEHLLESFPRDGKAQWGLAYAALWSGDPEEALVHAESTIELQPHAPWSHAAMGDAYSVLGEFDQAEAAYQKAIEIDLEEPQFLSQLATLYEQHDRVGQALCTREQAVALDPHDGTLHAELGFALWSNGDYGQALEHLLQAQDLGDDRDAVYSMLGLTYTEIGSYEEASHIYDAGLGTYPDSVFLHLGLGNLLMMQEQCEPAITEFEWVLEEDPGNEAALAGYQNCDAVLHPPQTPVPSTPAPAPSGTVTEAKARKLATNVIEGAGASVNEMAFETSEGVSVWVVSYLSQLTPGSEVFNQQQSQIVLGLSEITVRIEPSVGSLGVLATDSDGEQYNGVVVVALFAQLWRDGTLSNEEFIDTWFLIEP